MIRSVFSIVAVAAPLCLAAQGPMPACQALGSQEALATRASPLDSLSFRIGNHTAKICYSRPAARGRMVMDSLVPYGRIWRTGANEPTMIFLPGTAEIAGARLAAGRYILTTVPGPETWSVVFSTTEETEPARMFSRLTPVATGRASSERTDAHVERFTIRAEPGVLLLEWERTRVRVPFTAQE